MSSRSYNRGELKRKSTKELRALWKHLSTPPPLKEHLIEDILTFQKQIEKKNRGQGEVSPKKSITVISFTNRSSRINDRDKLETIPQETLSKLTEQQLNLVWQTKSQQIAVKEKSTSRWESPLKGAKKEQNDGKEIMTIAKLPKNWRKRA
jgi:hypothetical protein